MNNNLRRERGAIAISVLGSIILLAILLVVAGKLIPVYLEHSTVTSVLANLETGEFGSSTEIRNRIAKQFSIDGVRHINADAVSVVSGRRFFEVDISYEIKVPLVSNIEFLLTFSDQAEIPRN